MKDHFNHTNIPFRISLVDFSKVVLYSQILNYWFWARRGLFF